MATVGMIVVFLATVLAISSASPMMSLLKSQIPRNDIDCETCELVFKEIDSLLSGNDTQAKILSYLLDMCKELPTEVQPYCNTVVALYGKIILQTILQELDPATVCKDVGLCSSFSFLINRWQRKRLAPLFQGLTFNMNKKVSASPSCTLCETVVTEVEKSLKTPATLQKLNSTMYTACVTMGIKPAECLVTVNTIMSMMNTVLTLPASMICGLMGVCKSESQVAKLEMKNAVQMLLHSIGAPSWECPLCMDVMKDIDNYLTEHQSNVLSAINQFCQRLPSPVNQECTLIMDKEFKVYFPQFLNTTLSPKHVCIELGTCTTRVNNIESNDVWL